MKNIITKYNASTESIIFYLYITEYLFLVVQILIKQKLSVRAVLGVKLNATYLSVKRDFM